MMFSFFSLDFIGSVASIVSTVFFVRAHLVAWYLGMLAAGLNGYLYYRIGLYGELGVEFVYFISMLYGLYQWQFGGVAKTPLPISRLTKNMGFKLSGIILGGILFFSLFLKFFTNSRVPYWDGSATVLNLTAQWMTCKKIIENWWLWFLVDSLYVGLYLYKHIPFHATRNLCYLFMAVAGYWRWKTLM